MRKAILLSWVSKWPLTDIPQTWEVFGFHDVEAEIQRAACLFWYNDYKNYKKGELSKLGLRELPEVIRAAIKSHLLWWAEGWAPEEVIWFSQQAKPEGLWFKWRWKFSELESLEKSGNEINLICLWFLGGNCCFAEVINYATGKPKGSLEGQFEARYSGDPTHNSPSQAGEMIFCLVCWEWHCCFVHAVLMWGWAQVKH